MCYLRQFVFFLCCHRGAILLNKHRLKHKHCEHVLSQRINIKFIRPIIALNYLSMVQYVGLSVHIVSIARIKSVTRYVRTSTFVIKHHTTLLLEYFEQISCSFRIALFYIYTVVFNCFVPLNNETLSRVIFEEKKLKCQFTVSDYVLRGLSVRVLRVIWTKCHSEKFRLIVCT